MTTGYEECVLAPNLILRPAGWSDVEAVAQLIYDACVAEGDPALAISSEELKYEWSDPQFHVETDAFVAATSEGRVVGYAELTNSFEHAILTMNGNVHPDYKGRGIGTTLLRTVEKRARELMALAEPDVRTVIKTTISRTEPAGIALHENEGYRPIRYHWRMEIALNESPALPSVPAGIEIRPFIRGEHDVAVWQAQNDALPDEPGGHEWTLEEWRRTRFDDPEFDPSLWAIAWDGATVVGYSVNRYRSGIGWIRAVGVRRAWRKRGIAEALLLHSFGEYYRRGTRTIGLSVDAHSPTGATRLYQKVGMHPVSAYVTYEKELRPGRNVDGDW